jgi:hypothetical protein
MNEPKRESAPADAGRLETPVRPRAAFEAWISSPPYEREVERFGENSAWPGNYRELDVDLAWCAWLAAMATTRERCAQILERIANEPPVNGNTLAQARVLLAVAQLRGA